MRIAVYQQRDGRTYDPSTTHLVEIIDRKPYHKGFVGNFIPHWCRYKRSVYLIQGGIDYAYMHDVDTSGFYIVIPD